MRKPLQAKICSICGKEFIPLSHAGKYCSDECRKEAIRRSTHKYKEEYEYHKDAGLEKPKKEKPQKVSPASERWAKMTWKDLTKELDYYGLRYRDSQLMAQKGTLPKDFGLRKKVQK